MGIARQNVWNGACASGVEGGKQAKIEHLAHLGVARSASVGPMKHRWPGNGLGGSLSNDVE